MTKKHLILAACLLAGSFAASAAEIGTITGVSANKAPIVSHSVQPVIRIATIVVTAAAIRDKDGKQIRQSNQTNTTKELKNVKTETKTQKAEAIPPLENSCCTGNS